MPDHNRLVNDPAYEKIEKKQERDRAKKCSLCDATYVGFGNNAAPFPGRCCDKCNAEKVLPARVHNAQMGLPPYPGGKLVTEDEVNRLIDQVAVLTAAKDQLRGWEDQVPKHSRHWINKMNKAKKPWEFERPVGDIDGTEPFLNMNEALLTSALHHPPPFIAKSDAREAVKTVAHNGEPLIVESQEDKDLLIHLFHILQDPPPLVYAGASVFGHFLRALHDNDFLAPFNSREAIKKFQDQAQEMLPQLHNITPFVINHNWKAVLEKAGESEGGEFVLPNEDCTVFEFALQGMRVVAIATDLPEFADIGLHLWIRMDKRWVVLGAERVRESVGYKIVDGQKMESDAFYVEIRGQIRAACIMLEAEVAESKTIRADYKRNEKRMRHGQHPFFDYHIVNLATRHRVTPHDRGPAMNDKRQSPRLHFVKGHWRHFDNYKTRIKWHYRGDADLGFIDKEYRF